MKTTKICVVIVTWNNEKDIKTCLDSVFSSSYTNFEIVLVDNNSTDSTIKIVSENYKSISIIKNKKNYFLAKANNIGIKFAIKNFSPEFILVLNPDTKLETNTLELLLKTFEKDQKIMAVGPLIKFFNNKNEGLINSAGLIYDGFMQAYDRGFLEEDLNQYQKEEEVFAVSGACILYKTEVFDKVGFYDENIKMYLDEIELAIRIHKKGYTIFFNGNALILHNYMQSTEANKDFNREKQVKKAWLLIALKHYPILRKLAMIKKFLIK